MISSFEREIAFQSLREDFDAKICDLLRKEAVLGIVRILRKKGFGYRKNEDLHQLADDSFNITIAMRQRFAVWKQCFAYMTKVAWSGACKRRQRRSRESPLPESCEVPDREAERVFEGIDFAQALKYLLLKKEDLQLLESMFNAKEPDRLFAWRMKISVSTLKRRRSELMRRLRKHLKEYRS